MDANKEEFDKISRTIELPLSEGGMWKWSLLDPSQLLVSLVSNSPSLQQWSADAWRRSPPSPQRPWSLVVAFDEFVPGQQTANRSDEKDNGLVLLVLAARAGRLVFRLLLDDCNLRPLQQNQGGFRGASSSCLRHTH